MIVTVTPNTALDITYRLAGDGPLRLHTTNRAAAVTARAGGKGLNVARIAAALGHRVVATGLVGGAVGEELRAELAASAPTVDDALHPVAGATRRTVTLVDGSGDATIVNEPGPQVSAAEWAAFRAHVRELASRPGVRAVALCGSLPPGAPADGYAELVADARAAGVPVLLDASGEALARGLAARPDLVKPNADELGQLAGLDGPVDGPEAAVAAARALPAGAVVASLGADGLVAVAGDAPAIHVPAPERIAGNPIGAGDSAVAGLLTGLVEGLDWERRLRRAVALSAATVAAPVAGDYDRGVYERLTARLAISAAPWERTAEHGTGDDRRTGLRGG
ncbi:1-phosphofructokinase family hexose kinase [Mangrovactinospora gilvigrisea]|uniref:1-phosphofructokinase family hexose kinase n=1 Tax=Mangrovactinospora gilvigrisea TaxID=1428644 RepID=UPI0008FC1FE0|nr:1-phosphofructokinase family hexose kinase [Mangrovactinospora gilvigrisea]